jgi:hypothetical protein
VAAAHAQYSAQPVLTSAIHYKLGQLGVGSGAKNGTARVRYDLTVQTVARAALLEQDGEQVSLNRKVIHEFRGDNAGDDDGGRTSFLDDSAALVLELLGQGLHDVRALGAADELAHLRQRVGAWFLVASAERRQGLRRGERMRWEEPNPVSLLNTYRFQI